MSKKLVERLVGDAERKARKTKRHDKYETVVQYLLEQGAEVNARASFGRVSRWVERSMCALMTAC